jgi:hypothetical protein
MGKACLNMVVRLIDGTHAITLAGRYDPAVSGALERLVSNANPAPRQTCEIGLSSALLGNSMPGDAGGSVANAVDRPVEIVGHQQRAILEDLHVVRRNCCSR